MMEAAVRNLVSIWAKLDSRRRMIVAGATAAMFLAVIALARMAGAPDMALLYAGLEGQAAGAVMQALDQRGVNYRVQGDSILVPVAERDALRMSLAAEGLPETGPAGYELLDGLSGFGTTAQMFDAAYWRAKEGEIARTILANPAIRSARVHVAQAPSRPFQADARPTASVTVVTATGGLPQPQVRALQHLVAAAVAGLAPADVSVVDSQGGLLSADGSEGAADTAAETRAAALRKNVERLLEARVGAGKAVVEVSLDLVTDREQITERRFDPESRVAISTETQEKSDSSKKAAQDVTVASNLPEGDAANGGNDQSQSSETRETVNFEVSETQRELLRGPGAVRRLTVAVLVDGLRKTSDSGEPVWEPRPEEELTALRELVASAVGLDESRGDQLTLKSLPFDQPGEAGTGAEAGWLPPLGAIDAMSVIQLAVLGLVATVLGLFVVRPVLAGRGVAEDLPAPGAPLALPGQPADAPRVLTGEIADVGDLSGLPVISGEGFELPDDPVARLRRLIEARQTESVEILRGWLETEERA